MSTHCTQGFLLLFEVGKKEKKKRKMFNLYLHKFIVFSAPYFLTVLHIFASF